MSASATAETYSAAIDTQSGLSAAPQPASGSQADARTSASRLNQAPPSPGMLRLRRSWSEHGACQIGRGCGVSPKVVWTNDLPRRQASRDARVALSRWACWCSGWAPDSGQWMRPDLVRARRRPRTARRACRTRRGCRRPRTINDRHDMQFYPRRARRKPKGSSLPPPQPSHDRSELGVRVPASLDDRPSQVLRGHG
jgi:hypothetical protein